MNILYIDTTSNEKIKVGLRVSNKKTWVYSQVRQKSSQVVLPLIENLLKKNKIGLKEISGIEVNKGPGSFTGIRVGLSIANALSYMLKVPVNNKPLGEFEEPQYQ